MKVYVVVIDDPAELGDKVSVQKIFDSEEKANAYIEANSHSLHSAIYNGEIRVPNDASGEIYWIDYLVE